MAVWRKDGGFVTHCVQGHREWLFGQTPCTCLSIGHGAPDLHRVPSMALTQLGQWGWPVPPVGAFFSRSLPVGILLLAALVSLFFAAAELGGVRMLGGMMLHLVVTLQDHHGVVRVGLLRSPNRLDEQRSQHPMVADIAVDQCGTRHVATEKAVIRTTFALGHVVADVPAWHLKMSVED